MIPVTRPYLPDRRKLDSYLDGIYSRGWLTNNGPLVQLLTERLEEYLGVRNLLLVTNGTLALQIAYRAIGLVTLQASPVRRAVTTPFSFAATASSLQWEGVSPHFCDIDADSWCLDLACLAELDGRDIHGVVPVHVFGNACDIEGIQRLAERWQAKVVYDGAHAFGVDYRGTSLLQHGDATTLSLHATKLFHSVEGGAVIFRDREDLQLARELINFGIGPTGEIRGLGINAKLSELHAAMALCVLDDIAYIMESREAIWCHYVRHLDGCVDLQQRHPLASNNYAYFPVAFPDSQSQHTCRIALEAAGIMPRNYFHPSLDECGFYGASGEASRSRSLSSRILCLPIYPGLSLTTVERIADVVKCSITEAVSG